MFCNFLLQDEDVVNSLLAASKRLSGHVYILTTLKAQDFASAGEKEEDGGEDFETHIKSVQRITANGLPVKARSDCHAKFMTVDDARAIVTSANAVPTCYGNVPRRQGGTRSANPENGVLINIRFEVARLANFFRAMWRDGFNYYVSPDPEVFEIHQIEKAARQVNSREPEQPSSDGEVLWTAPSDPRLLHRFIRMIQEAQKKVSISTYVIKGMDNHALGEAICDVADRGVRFDILVRGMNNRDDHRKQCYRLSHALGANGRILGDYWNHSKAVVVDSREAMVLSANMDAQHGLDNGIEVGFYSFQRRFVKAVELYLDRLTSEAAFEMACDLTQDQVARRYAKLSNCRIGNELTIRPRAKNRHHFELLQQWCSSAERELVRVANPNREEHNEVCLMTNSVAIRGLLKQDKLLEVSRIDEDSKIVQSMRFQGYLRHSSITLELPH